VQADHRRFSVGFVIFERDDFLTFHPDRADFVNELLNNPCFPYSQDWATLSAAAPAEA
jgi:hypothetical protein